MRGETPAPEPPQQEPGQREPLLSGMGLAPPQDVFTDGSARDPTWPAYALGGAAAWEQRSNGQYPTIARDDYSDRIWESEGMGWAAKVPGRIISSTRTEIFAGLLALKNEGPTCIYTGSKGFRAMHRRVCAELAGRHNEATLQTKER